MPGIAILIHVQTTLDILVFYTAHLDMNITPMLQRPRNMFEQGRGVARSQDGVTEMSGQKCDRRGYKLGGVQ